MDRPKELATTEKWVHLSLNLEMGQAEEMAVMRKSEATGTLNSWKEIATYLDRGIRTVQRWEREHQLPVHRIGPGKRAPVFAKVSELNLWMSTSERPCPKQPEPLQVIRRDGKLIENSRRLLRTVNELTQQIAESSVRQRRYAEQLQACIVRMRSRFNK